MRCQEPKIEGKYLSRLCLIVTTAFSTLTLAGCVYRLHVPFQPAQQRLKLLVRSPEQYSVRVWDKEFPVGADGNVLIEFPSIHGCSVYLFDRIPISQPADPIKSKSIKVTTAGRTVKHLSGIELSKLPVDRFGAHLLEIASRH